MGELFHDQSVWREHQRWKSLYAKPVSIMNDTQLFANFGSDCGFRFEEIDTNETINGICDRLAEEIIDQLFAEPKIESRHIQTSNFNRKPYFNRVVQKTPLQGHDSRRNLKSNQHLAIDNNIRNRNSSIIHRRSRSTT